jgi:hypothetical protein
MDQSQTPRSLISTERTVVLQKCISAIPISFGKGGRPTIAPMAMLPEGAALEICGDGLNELTVTAHWAGKSYFVFRQDIRPSRKPSGSERLHIGVMRQGS